MKKPTAAATVSRSRFFWTTPLPPNAPEPPKVVARPASLPEWRKISKQQPHAEDRLQRNQNV